MSISSGFLDNLFVSIRDKIPSSKWVNITKNHEQVVEGIKHLIDNECYGEPIVLEFNGNFTKFRKLDVSNTRQKEGSGKQVSTSKIACNNRRNDQTTGNCVV